MEQTSLTPLAWSGDRLRLLDQTRLPHEEVWFEIDDHRGVAEAIRTLRVRGAPAIGVAAAYGLALAAQNAPAKDREGLLIDLRRIAADLEMTRPTAVNLAWGLKRVLAAAIAADSVEGIREAALAEAQRIQEEDIEANKRLGRFGAELLPDRATVLTHCNTGSLATAGYGTALGVVRAAVEMGKRIRVIATETRPLLQGARLTAWELTREGIDCTLIVDGAAGVFMSRGRVDAVVVGADRIAADGDVANKVGTYTLALLAREHGLPFYVAAPTSTIDLKVPSGANIPIEERSPDEVTGFGGVRIAAESVAAANPAFDITPHKLVNVIVTERGIARPPYLQTLRELAEPVAPPSARQGAGA